MGTPWLLNFITFCVLCLNCHVNNLKLYSSGKNECKLLMRGDKYSQYYCYYLALDNPMIFFDTMFTMFVSRSCLLWSFWVLRNNWPPRFVLVGALGAALGNAPQQNLWNLMSLILGMWMCFESKHTNILVKNLMTCLL